MDSPAVIHSTGKRRFDARSSTAFHPRPFPRGSRRWTRQHAEKENTPRA